MSRTLRRTLGLFALTAASALAVPGAASAAEAFYGVTQDNRLVAFQSDNVTNVEPSRAITGLPGGENIVGLDVRPLNGQLYALGKTSRYSWGLLRRSIHANTAAASSRAARASRRGARDGWRTAEEMAAMYTGSFFAATWNRKRT